MTEKWTPTVREGESIEDVPLSRWIGEALGAASMCWKLNGHQVTPIGEFDSVEAGRIHDALMARIQEAMGEDESIDRTERGVVDEVRSAVFSETGEDRVTTAHQRITDESRRINKLRDQIADLRNRVAESGAIAIADLERAVKAVTDRARLMEERMAMVEDQYVTEAGFNDLIGRVRRLENQTEFETSEDDANIRDLVRRVRALEERSTSVVQAVENRLDDLENSPVVMTIEDWESAMQRIAQLERNIKNMREVEDARQRAHERNGENLGKRITEMGQAVNEMYAALNGGILTGGVAQSVNAEEAPHDFSYPVGAGAGKAERVAHGSVQQSWTLGHDAALDHAEQRVRQYMNSHRRNAWTLDDVIEALRGE